MNDFTSDFPFAICFQYFQFQLPIVHEHRLTGLHIPSKFFVGGINHAIFSVVISRANDQFLAIHQLHFATDNVAYAKLWTLQIRQQSGVRPQFFIYFTHVGNRLSVHRIFAMRKVQTRHIHSSLDECMEHFL